MDKKYTAHILSHTHWDREWYLNSPYTNEWLIPFFNGLFAMMDKEPEYKFILDGQLSMVEDYFEELSKNGLSVAKARRTIRGHVRRGALFIGPYYLQPDWQLLSEESLVRNLLVGQTLAEPLGGSMKSGWLLDNFGQISQTSQIHKLAGITGLFAWRGVAMDPEKVTHEFIWEAPDGSRLPSIYLLNSYRNVMRLAEYKSIMRERMDAEVKKLKPFLTTSNILMMNGYDQEMVPDDIQPYIRSGELNGEDYQTVQNDPDSFIQAVLDEKPDLPILKGALYNGRFISVFPGVMSSRMYLKIQNDDMQRLLEKKAEPLSLMAGMLGADSAKSQLNQAWKLLLKNHPHDSICGVSIDDVHTDMENRTRQVRQLGMSLLEERGAFFAGAVDTSACSGDEALIVFNTMPTRRSAVVPWGDRSVFVRDLPAMGYKTIQASELPDSVVAATDQGAENSRIKVEFNTNGSFNLTLKETGRRYENLGLLEDMGDSGDEYNYSWPDSDTRYTTADVDASVKLVSSEPWEAVFQVRFEWPLPVSDVDGHTKRSEELLVMPVVTEVTIEAESPVLKCRTMLRNTVRDHRVRVLFPSGIDADTAYAGSPFDITERPVHIADYDESEIPEHVRKVIVGAREAKPSTYFQTREFLDLNDGDQGLALFNRGLPEYQVIDDKAPGTMALTLFRSVGWIAKEINSRIGDAGPEIYTPDAQCLRDMCFEYAVCPHSGDAFAGVIQESEEYSAETVAIAVQPSAGVLPATQGWLSVDDPDHNTRITAVKSAEDGSGIVVRGVNLGVKDTTIRIRSDWTASGAQLVNLLEESIKDLELVESGVSLSLRPKEIFTVKFSADPERLPVIPDDSCIVEDGRAAESFDGYEYADYVTDEDIRSEEARADKLREKIEDPMWRRTALEAQLSVILARHRQDEVEIRRLGYGLNEARVHRRIHDYLGATLPKK